MNHRSPLPSSLLLVASALAGCAHASGAAVRGPRHDQIPVYRPYSGADKLYVEADPGDGVERLFMVDTGASISVVTPEVAEALKLTVSDGGDQLVGLGGRAAWRRASLAELEIGAYEVRDVEVAVGVPGVPTTAGLAPVAGILGNNVWGRFQLSVDYRANLLELARPGNMDMPSTAVPMVYNGQHVATSATLLAGTAEAPVTKTVTLEVDTGARGVVVSGSAGQGLEALATEGEEVILGVGAGDDVPTANFVRQTRRVPLRGITLGGMDIDRDMELTWLNYDASAEVVGPPDLRGLIGHDALEGNRVIFDYPGGRFAIVPSDRKPVERDIHEVLLASLKRRSDLDSLRLKATTLAILSRSDEANKVIDRVLDQKPGDPEVTVLRARMYRDEGRAAEGLALTRALSPGDLVDQSEIVAVVNGLWLAGEPAEGLRVAQAAVQERPDSAEAWIALADAARVSGDFAAARSALREANRVDELPEGHLLRRAWLAGDEGDNLSGITHARRLLDRAPTWGATLWLYSQLATASGDTTLLQADLDRALGRLHPGDQPLDFAAMAWRISGDAEKARTLAQQGMKRDCDGVEDAPAKANCEAWYMAMGGIDLPSAETLVTDALKARPERSEYLDTRATVLEAQGRLDEARAAAWQAAALSPDDVYLLWQAARIDREARAASKSTLQ